MNVRLKTKKIVLLLSFFAIPLFGEMGEIDSGEKVYYENSYETIYTMKKEGFHALHVHRFRTNRSDLGEHCINIENSNIRMDFNPEDVKNNRPRINMVCVETALWLPMCDDLLKTNPEIVLKDGNCSDGSDNCKCLRGKNYGESRN